MRLSITLCFTEKVCLVEKSLPRSFKQNAVAFEKKRRKKNFYGKLVYMLVKSACRDRSFEKLQYNGQEDMEEGNIFCDICTTLKILINEEA